MSQERFEIARLQFEKALARLNEALAQDETALVRDALIQRFEFTYELGWKCMFYWLRTQKEKVPEVVRQVLQAAFRAELIADAELWERIKDYRDETSHTYDEKKAIEVAAFVRSQAVHAFQALLARLTALQRSSTPAPARFGIAPTAAGKLLALFESTPGLERVWIYGSRARGDYREASDIDLAVDAPGMSERDFLTLSSGVEDLGLIYRVDVLRLQDVADDEFRARIERDRQVFWAPRPRESPAEATRA